MLVLPKGLSSYYLPLGAVVARERVVDGLEHCFFNYTATTEIYTSVHTLSLHDALPIFRRRQSGRASDVLRFGRLEIDRDARTVRVDGVERSLTGYQFTLLVALAEKAGRVLSRATLMDLVRGEALEAFDRSIDVHVSRIRAAIEDDPKRPRRLLTVRGAGYVFAKQQD